MLTLTQTTGHVMAYVQVTHVQGVFWIGAPGMHAMGGVVVCSVVLETTAAVLCWQQAPARDAKRLLVRQSLLDF
jgi:hypothetical protein